MQKITQPAPKGQERDMVLAALQALSLLSALSHPSFPWLLLPAACLPWGWALGPSSPPHSLLTSVLTLAAPPSPLPIAGWCHH